MIGGVYSIMGLANAVSQIPAGYLSDRFGSRSIMWGSWILGTLAAWTMALAPSLPFFVVGVALYGLTGFVLAPMNSYLTSMRGNLNVGRAVSIPSAAFNLGAVLGPVIGGVVAEHSVSRWFISSPPLFSFFHGHGSSVHKQEGVHEADRIPTIAWVVG
jgi:DHA1 family tetracycline resistance protein-like MFS transporter